MSQYPPPFSQRPYPQSPYQSSYVVPDPMANALTPARRAGTLQIIVGALMIIFGLCAGFFVWAMPLDQFFKEANVPPPPGVDLHLLRAAIIGTVILAFVAAVCEIVLGFFVRRGGRGPAVASVVINVAIVLYLASGVIGNLAHVGSGSPQAALGVCFSIVPVALVGLLVAWLMQAVRGAAQVQAMREALQQQGWGQPPNYAQMVNPQQGYGPAMGPQAYGYGSPYAQPSWPQPPAPGVDYGYGAPPAGPQTPGGQSAPPAPTPPANHEGDQGSKDG